MVTRKWLTLLGLNCLILTACHLTTRPPAPQPTIPFSSTHILTPALPTPAISQLAVLTNYLEDAHIVNVDTLDDPSGWTVDKILNEEIFLVGSGDNEWYGLSSRAIFQEGNGAVINFKFTPGEFFEMYFEHGPWRTDLYKRFGVYVNEDHSNINLFTGTQRKDPSLIAGNLSLLPGTWYSLLLAVGKGGDFVAAIWDPANPGNSLQYREVIENWKEIEWTFRIQANKGTIVFDDFEEITFEDIK